VTKRVLLLGLKTTVVGGVGQQVHDADVELIEGTGMHDVRSAFAGGDIDHVIMGAGLDLETRLALIREVSHLSDLATVHMQDRVSGPAGLLPFVRSVLLGMKDYEPHAWSQATPPTQRLGQSS
jgi:hypothetical protein